MDDPEEFDTVPAWLDTGNELPLHRPIPRSLPPPARNFAEVDRRLQIRYDTPVRTLAQALYDLQLLDARTLARLAKERGRLLRDGHQELARQGVLSHDELGRALALSAALPEVDAMHFQIDPEAWTLLSAAQARGLGVLPLGRRAEMFMVAAPNPTDADLHRRLQELTGSSVLAVWADSASIDSRLQAEDGHGLAEPMTMEWSPSSKAQRPAEEPQTLEALIARAGSEVNVYVNDAGMLAVGEASAMAQLVQRMVEDARACGASDIHVESHSVEGPTNIRYRVDGDLRPYITVPAVLRAALVSRLKIMARLDISEHRRPQDGKINFAEHGGERLELRVAVLPTNNGLEDVVLRLLGMSDPLPLSALGLQKRDQETVHRLASHSWGLVLAAGPTGSGKTTTLHSMLMQLNTPERKIWTAEDPIEITQPGLNQVQMNPKIGLTFASALRSFLRADPDVIMIGEMRDLETATIAVEASLTGHLVLSTLHTNTAADSVLRLLELGLDPLNFADSLLGVVAQRLVRALCGHCAQWRELGADEVEALVDEYIGPGGKLPRDEARQRLLACAGEGAAPGGTLRVRVACGCPVCDGKGYKGRMGIYEIMEVSPRVRELIQLRARSAEIHAEAVAGGMRSLRHDALEKLVQGRIDLVNARAAFM